MTFSQRMGITPVKTELEKEGMSDELRNGLWSVIRIVILDSFENSSGAYSSRRTDLHKFYRRVWLSFLKKPIDSLTLGSGGTVSKPDADQILRGWYYGAKWYEVLNFLEFCSKVSNDFSKMANSILQLEFSAYRFIDGILVQINSEEELIELDNAVKSLDPTSPAREHLKQAMVLFSDRANPDYRNSIKESISAVESLVKALLKDEKAGFSQALKKLRDDYGIHPALKGAFEKLYGYTSDSGGIRHAMKDGDVPVEAAEARFMLVTCSAFVNYLITKLS